MATRFITALFNGSSSENSRLKSTLSNARGNLKNLLISKQFPEIVTILVCSLVLS